MEVPSFYLQCPISVLTVYDHHTEHPLNPVLKQKLRMLRTSHRFHWQQNPVTNPQLWTIPLHTHHLPHPLSAAVTNQLFFALFELFNDNRQEQAARFACLQINNVAELVLLLLLLREWSMNVSCMSVLQQLKENVGTHICIPTEMRELSPLTCWNSTCYCSNNSTKFIYH